MTQPKAPRQARGKTRGKVRTTPHRALNDAFRDYMAERPWIPLKDHHVLVLTHPTNGSQMYAIAMGDGGQEYGISLYTGEDGFHDMAGIITGHHQHNARSPLLGAMAKYPPHHPLGQPPVMVCHRVNPASTAAGFITNILVNQLPKVTVSDKEALAHAFNAATDLARTAANPDSPVKPRYDRRSLHMITATLKDGNWRYEMEAGSLQFQE